MRTLAADIRHGHYGAGHDLTLHIEIPLLHVRPDSLSWNGIHTERKCNSTPTDIGVADDVVLRGVEHQRRAALQRFRVAFVAIGVFEEDSVSATNCSFAVAEGIVRETDAWRGIEEMAFHATGGNTAGAALYQASETDFRYSVRLPQLDRLPNRRHRSSAPKPNCKPPDRNCRLALISRDRCQTANAKSQVEREFLGHAPIILDVRL